MNEIYWITRLDAVNSFLIIIIVFASIITIFTTFVCSITYNISGEEKTFRQCLNVIKIAFPVFIISTLMYIFTPTTKEAYMIYGLGGTIDYIKSNEKAKQLPDKVIIALDKYLDGLNKENKE